MSCDQTERLVVAGDVLVDVCHESQPMLILNVVGSQQLSCGFWVFRLLMVLVTIRMDRMLNTAVMLTRSYYVEF